LYRILHSCLAHFERDRNHKNYSANDWKRGDTIWDLRVKPETAKKFVDEPVQTRLISQWL
jgi:hypothetical protein